MAKTDAALWMQHRGMPEELLQMLRIDDPPCRQSLDPDTDTWSVGRAI